MKFSEAFDASPAQLLDAACQLGHEGVMLKKADAPYVSSRTDTWLKLKCQKRQEFVVIETGRNLHQRLVKLETDSGS